MHVDDTIFLAEFESYLSLSAIAPDLPRAVAAIHLHLTGPAPIWFNNLSVIGCLSLASPGISHL